MNLVWLLFSFNGRINRLQFWLGCLIGGVASTTLLFLLSLGTMPVGGFAKTPEGLSQFTFALGVTLGLPMLLSGWVGGALQTKRFHDRGRSGLWTMAPMLPTVMVIFSLVSTVVQIFHGLRAGSFIGGETMLMAALASAGMWLMILVLVYLFMLVDLGCMPGVVGSNKYGNPPGGGFTGGGAPLSGGAPIPGTPTPSRAQPMMPGMGGTTLTGAESAIEKAIAARSKQQAVAANAPVSAPRPAAAPASQAAPALRSAAAGSFGRKASS